MNNHDRIEQIRQRCNAARKGPWFAVLEGRDQTGGSSFIQIGEGATRGDDLYLSGDEGAVPTADYDFIANARQDIAFLLEEIERLRNLRNS